MTRVIPLGRVTRETKGGDSPNVVVSTDPSINDGQQLAANQQCVASDFPGSVPNATCNTLSGGESPNVVISTDTSINDGQQLAANQQCVASDFPGSVPNATCNSLSGC